jgi:protein-disulfide isomerase
LFAPRGHDPASFAERFHEQLFCPWPLRRGTIADRSGGFAMIRLLAALAIAAAFGLGPPTARAAEPLKPDQVEQFERVIRDYLLRKPEVLLEAMKALEDRQRDMAADMARERIGQHAKALRNDPNSFVAGNPNGDVTIVEFFDYRCGYCKQAHPTVSDVVKSDGKIRLVLKEFPILGADSMFASRAAVAVLQSQKAKYKAFHDALFDSKEPLNEASVLRIAKAQGLDTDKLAATMKTPEVEKVLRANHDLAQSLSITGTPAFIIGDELVPGAIPARQMIELVARARGGCTTC